MNQKLKQLIDAMREPILAAFSTMTENVTNRFNAVEVKVRIVNEGHEKLRAAYENHAAKALSLEQLTEKITGAFRERDETTVSACTKLVTALSTAFEERLKQVKDSFSEELLRSVTNIKGLIENLPKMPELPDIPEVPDLETIARAAAELVPVPKDGKDGDNGVSPTIEQLEELVAKAVAKVEMPTLPSLETIVSQVVKHVPVPKDGKDGDNGVTPTVEQLEELVQKAVAKVEMPTLPEIETLALAAAELVPVPKDGKDGDNGVTPTVEQLEELVQKAVAKVEMPTVSDIALNVLPVLSDKVESLSSSWALSFERLAQERFLKIIDQIPKPKDGKDGDKGKDGISAKSWKVQVLDGGRVLRNIFVVDNEEVVQDIKTEFTVYRGYYKASQEYEAGDAVTFGGSLFVATKVTKSKPETDDTWQLAVKRGRDGLPGKKGDPGKEGVSKTVREIEIDPFKVGTR